MVLTALPLLSPAAVPVASAEAVQYQVPSGATVDQITAQLATYASGTEVNVLLQSDVNFTSKDPDSNDETIGIVIPANITVNLYMNGKSIKYERNSSDEGADWRQKGIFAIVNNGNLNIYSGNPSRPDLASGNATISVINQRTGMSISEDEKAYSRIDAVVNGGNLTVNKAVKIQVTNYLGYKDQSAERGATTVATTGIYNTSNTSTCKIKAATVDVLAQAHAITERTSSDVEHGRSFAYGIYGGQVDISGASVLHTNAYARMACSDAGASNKENGCLITVAYDVCTSGEINITGGEFTYETSHDCNKAVTNKGSSWCYEGAVCYSGAAPMIADGTFTPPTTTTGVRGNNKTYNEAIVTKMSVLPYSGYALFHTDSTPGTSYNGVYDTFNEPSKPTGTVQAGQFVDEAGNISNCALDTTDDATHPTPIVRGGTDGKSRVHVIYRYWTSSTKSAIDISVVSSDGNVGYSTAPVGDGTNVVNAPAVFSGLSTGVPCRTSSATVGYTSGGESKNDYYWKQFNIAYTTTSAWFSDFDPTSTSNRGTVFKSFVDATNSNIPSGSDPLYIFCDYYRVAPTSITATIGANNAVTTTYTGSPVKASQLGSGLKIRYGTNNTDCTADYNIDLAANDPRIPVTYTWTGTDSQDNDVNGTGELPTDAGTYTVNVTTADDTDYDPNDCDPVRHKNRSALNYSFALTINKANAVSATVPAAMNLTYGEKLSEKYPLSGYTAKGVKNETLTGAFVYDGGVGNIFKPVGTSNIQVVWQPSGESAKNYTTTSFPVNCKVDPAQLVISPNAAAVTYGETIFDTPYGITVSGLVANDNNETAKADIANAINYMILVNSNYVVYSPDDVGAGVYDIRARVNPAAVPAVLSNYTYSYADITDGYEVNQLTVAKRSLTVQASAVSRGYDPDNYNVNVTYNITGGKYGVDDVRIPTGTGTLSVNDAGIREVGSVTKATAQALMTGGAAANYTVGSVVYDTGDTLKVEITKAVPSVSTPSVADVYYRRLATLADISINTGSTSVPGSWQWNDPTINPTVARTSYTAKFVPEDTTNYDVKTVEVPVTVKPSAVTVTYNGTVEYGDPVPNITAYTYSSVQDPDVSISYITTSGNITPSTTYVQGAPVNADGYPVTISAPNYKDVAGNYVFNAVSGKISVVPRNIEFTVQNVSIVYGDNFTASASTVSLTHDDSRFVGADTLNSITSDGTEPVFSYTTTFRYQDNYKVGTYEIKATPAFNTSPNYTVSVVNGTLTVTKAPLTIKANNITLAYNSDVPANLSTAYTFVGAKRNEGLSAIVSSGSILVDTNYEKGSPVNSEGYPISIDVSDAVIGNYSVSVENGKITVIKATPEITEYPTASIVYGQSLADAVFTGGTVKDNVAGTYVYGSGSTVPAFSTEAYTIYSATFVPADTANYNTVPGLYIALSVNKMPVSGALAVTGIPMNGETLTVDVSGLSPDEIGVYTFEWSIDGATVGTGSSFVLGEDEVGKTVTVTATAQGYYEGTVSYVTTEIAPILDSVEDLFDELDSYFTLAGLDAYDATTSVVYDAEKHPVSLTQKGSTLSNTVIGTITVKYNGSTEIPVNAGLYTVTVDVATPDLSRVGEAGVTIYSPASNLTIGTLEITKAPYNVTVTISDKVYDGYNTAEASDIDESGAVELAGGTSDDVYFDAANAVYTFADANIGTGKTVSSGSLALAGASKDNYELNVTLANGGKASITPRTLKVSVEPIDREYQENYYDVDLSFVVDVTSIAPADTSSSVYVNEALASGTVDDYHAGERRVTVSDVVLTGPKAANYVLEITNINTVSVTIEKATPSYPIPNTGIVYYDAGRTLSNISLGDTRWAWSDDVANKIPQAGTHTFSAVYTPDDQANFAPVEYEVTLEVRKAPVVVKAASFNVVYGESEPTYSYTLTGLTGADKADVLGGYVIINCAYAPGTEVGVYNIVLSGGFTSSNYSFTYQNGIITVNPRAAYVTVLPQEREYEDGNLNVTVNFSELSNIFEADAGMVGLSATSVTGTVATADAGTKPVEYALPELTGTKANNYTLKVLNPSEKAVIAKAHIAGIVLPARGVIEYGQRLSETVFEAGYSGTDYGTFTMENPGAYPEAVGVTNNKYKVVFNPFSSVNYASESAFITLDVRPADLYLTLKLSGTVQAGQKIVVTPLNIPDEAKTYVTYSWYVVDNATDSYQSGTLRDAGTTEYTVKTTDAGKYIVCVAGNSSNSPYNISGEVRGEGNVQEETLSFWQKIVKWFYRLISSITQLFGGLLG